MRIILLTILILSLPAFAADTPHAAPLMRDFIGIDGHFSFRPELYRTTCGLVRNYHPTIWDLGDDTSLATTFPLARNQVNWADTYGVPLKKDDVKVKSVDGNEVEIESNVPGSMQVPIRESPIYLWLKLP